MLNFFLIHSPGSSLGVKCIQIFLLKLKENNLISVLKKKNTQVSSMDKRQHSVIGCHGA